MYSCICLGVCEIVPILVSGGAAILCFLFPAQIKKGE